VATVRIAHYDIGDLWTPQATFTVGGTPTDPTTITVTQQAPDGTETVLAAAVNPATLNSGSTPVAKTGTGVFKVNPGVSITAAGRWYVKFVGTGTAAAADTHVAIGDPDPFLAESGIGARALVSLEDAKDWLQHQGVTFDEDLELVRVINDISDRFMQEAQREFKPISPSPAARLFDVDVLGWRTGIVLVGDLASAPTTVEILDTNWSTVLETVSAANYTLHPQIREAWEPIRRIEFNYGNGVTYLRRGFKVRVTGTWGFPSVPGNVRQAVLDSVAWVMDRDVEHYRQDLGFGGVNAQPGSGGTVVMIGGGRQRLLTLPASAQAVAWSYRDLLVG
jgi:hypothetical protein